MVGKKEKLQMDGNCFFFQNINWTFYYFLILLHNRVYFVNHVTKTTQWDRPKLPAQPQEITNGSPEDIIAPSVPSRSSTCSNLKSGPSTNGVPERTPRRHSSEIVVQNNGSPSRKAPEETRYLFN